MTVLGKYVNLEVLEKEVADSENCGCLFCGKTHTQKCVVWIAKMYD